MKSYQVKICGSICTVEIGYCVEAVWDDGTVEYLTLKNIEENPSYLDISSDDQKRMIEDLLEFKQSKS